MLRTTDPTMAATIVSAVSRSGGKSPTVSGNPATSAMKAVTRNSAGVDQEPDETHRHEADRQRGGLDERPDEPVDDPEDDRQDDQPDELAVVAELRQQLMST